jgi:hypothetical protein
MNPEMAVELIGWLGKPIADVTAGLAEHEVEVLAHHRDANPFGPLATLASAAVRVYAGDQVIALVTAGRVAGFQPAPTGVGGLDHRVAVLDRRVTALEGAGPVKKAVKRQG